MQLEDYVVFATLPLSEDAFLRDTRADPARRLASTMMLAEYGSGPWSDASVRKVWRIKSTPPSGAIYHLLDVLDEVEQHHGIRVFRATAFDTFAEELRSGASQVVSLFAHSTGTYVEFRDGMRSVDEVANLFTNVDARHLVLDLNACRASSLHDAIRRAIGDRLRIFFQQGPARLSFRANCYRLAIRLLKDIDYRSFLDAYVEAWRRMRSAVDEQQS